MSQGPGVRRARIGRRAATTLASLVLLATRLPAQEQTAATSRTTTVTTTSSMTTVGAIDSKAVSALRSMGAYLRTLKSFGVNVKGAKDEVMDDGQKILISGTVNYLVRTPDRFRAEINTDRKQRTIYYDGKTLTLYAPRMHYYATVTAPPTVMQMLDTVRAKYGVELPIADLFLWGTPTRRREGPDAGQVHRALLGRRHRDRPVRVPAAGHRLADLDREGKPAASTPARHHERRQAVAAAVLRDADVGSHGPHR